MRQIAYKIADNTLVKDSLPSGWITEYTYVDLQPEGSIGPEWTLIDEDQFQNLLQESNSELKMQNFIDEKHQQDLIKQQEYREQATAEKLAKESLDAEFEAFKAWKASQNQ